MENDFGAIQTNITKSLVATTRTVTSLSAADLPFHRSLNPSLSTSLDRQNARLLALSERLLERAASGSEAVSAPKLRDADAIDNEWRAVVDVVDSLLEKVDTNLDQYTGRVKKLSPDAVEKPAAFSTHPRKLDEAFRTRRMEKPQLLFEAGTQNYEPKPWKPLLTRKPFATIPLEQSLQTRDEDGSRRYPHPYEKEIEEYRFPDAVYRKAEPIPYHPFETTTATFVDTEDALAEMLEELKQAKEVAIDIEHHEVRTYIGLVSLMQISTRNRDWVVDTLKPWRRRLECLNEVFANPSILKVLHGAHMDAIWLQRDLGLYLVGLFDTHWASRALGYPGGSLAYLLDRFINFEAQKQYQMADWRIRPLPKELFDYARSDTHFLLYIYDNMRNELIDRSDFNDPEKDKVTDVLEKSKEVALQRYEYHVYDEVYGLGGNMGWYHHVKRTPEMFSKEQFSVYRALHKWRDTIARQEDESPAFVMPNPSLLSIAREMPTNKHTLFNARGQVSQVMSQRAEELLELISSAKAAGVNGPEMTDAITATANKLYPQDRRIVQAAVTAAPEITAPPTAAALFEKPSSVTSAVPVRADASRFWGKSVSGPSHDSQQKRSMSTSTNGVSLALPLPHLTAQLFMDPAEAAKAEQQRQAAYASVRAEHAYVKKADRPQQQQDDVFIVKQAGGGRKRKLDEEAPEPVPSSRHSLPGLSSPQVVENGLDENSDEVQLEDLSQQAAQRKASQKAAKKAAKRAARENAAIQSNGTGGIVTDEPLAPFDYSTAPSVLNPAKSGNDKEAEKKGFNPYAKALDTGTGARRRHGERPGKSGTFMFKK